MLASLRRYKLGVVLTVILAGASAYALALTNPVLYAAETTVFFEDPNVRPDIGDGGGGFSDPSRFVRNSVDIAASSRVARNAHELADTDLPLETFAASYSVEASALDRDSLVIRALGRTPEEAEEIANAVVESYRALALEENTAGTRRLLADYLGRLQTVSDRAQAIRAEIGTGEPTFVQQQRLEQTVNDLNNINDQVASYEQQISAIGDGVRFVDSAESEGRVQPQPRRAAAAGALLGFVLAAAVAWWRNSTTRTIEARNQPATVLGAPLLGEVPDFSACGVAGVMPAATAPFSAPGEAYQFLAASLQHMLRGKRNAVVLVTSAQPGDGKSVTAMNLAMTVASGEERVIVIDADARARGLSRLAGVEDRAGLTDFVDGAVSLPDAITKVQVDDTSVELMALGGGMHDPASFFRTSAFRSALTRVRDEADLVVIDSPPLLAVAETSAMAAHADGLVLVVGRGTSIQALEEVADRLAFVGTPLLGYIFNFGRPPRSGGGYGYGYGYGEPPSARPRPKSDPAKRRPEPVEVPESLRS